MLLEVIFETVCYEVLRGRGSVKEGGRLAQAEHCNGARDTGQGSAAHP